MFLPSMQKVKLEKVKFQYIDRACCGFVSFLTRSVAGYLCGSLRVIGEAQSLRLCEKSKQFFQKALVQDALTIYIHLIL